MMTKLLSNVLVKGLLLGGPLALAAGGCAGRASILPNNDPGLQRTSAEFAADAAKRHPYKADAPRGGEALGRAQIDYTWKTIELLNYSDEDWDNVEFWINEKFVLFVPKIDKSKQRTELMNFQMFYDDAGNYFWTQSGKVKVDKFEMYRDGKMYGVKLVPAD